MNVVTDLDKCIGSGMCTTIAPQVFALSSETDKVVLLVESVPKELERAVEDATACCPVEAIEAKS